ncbi:MAG TPA: hypothetical protein VES73_00180, partial [Lamprocystis sp. (in: g-proteobacteria)]|nr:hypothetical protein [Lamprocystis sp. (in: g-proteobacteria)]
VFADSSLFCGKDDVIHAIIYHQMLKAGASPLRIAREQALSGNRVDVVLFGVQVFQQAIEVSVFCQAAPGFRYRSIRATGSHRKDRPRR